MPSELLTEVESKVKDRIKELLPLHNEYLELSAWAERAGIELNGSAPRKPPAAKPAAAKKSTPRRKAGKKAAAKTTAAKPATAKASSRFPNGVPDRRADLLRIVNENPGVTVREVGDKLETDATQLYRHRNALVEEGLIESRGPNLFPKSEAKGNGESGTPAWSPGGGDGGNGA